MIERPQQPNELRGRRLRGRLLAAVFVLAAFGVGVALGQALHDNPRPGGASTSFRTLPARSGP